MPLILLLQAITSLLALRNTAFQDEALYVFAGQQIFLNWLGQGSYLEPYGLYFSGYPFFYPVIGGVLDLLGGLEAARLFSLLCMLIVTICVYYLTLQWFERKSALVAAFLFACEGSVLFLGRLATYDALCCCFLALAVTFSLWDSKATSSRRLLALGPLLVLLVAAKYAGLLFVPSILALFAWWCWKHQGWKEMLVRLKTVLFSLVVSGFIGFLDLDKQALTGLSVTTINRVSYTDSPPLVVIAHIAAMEGIFFGLAFLGLLLCGRQRLLTGLLLFGSALLVPFYHTYKGELVSLDKHLTFSMFFLAPLAGFTIVSLASRLRKYTVGFSWAAALILCLLTFPPGLLQARMLYESWPSSTQLTAFLRPRVHKGMGHYLAEDFNVLRYNLKNETDTWQWSSLDYFVYTDKDKHNLSGEAAYRAAIQEGYFDLIELNYGYHTALATQITQSLAASHSYDLVARIPLDSSDGDSSFWVWSKHGGVPNGAANNVWGTPPVVLSLDWALATGRSTASILASTRGCIPLLPLPCSPEAICVSCSVRQIQLAAEASFAWLSFAAGIQHAEVVFLSRPLVCYTHGCWGIGDNISSNKGGGYAQSVTECAHLVRSTPAL